MSLNRNPISGLRYPTIYRRVLSVAMVIFAIFAIYLYSLQRNENHAKAYTYAATEAISKLGFLDREFREGEYRLPMDGWQQSKQYLESKLLYNICDSQGRVLYRSERMQEAGLNSICDTPKQRPSIGYRDAIQLNDGNSYFLVPVPLETPEQVITIAILQPADQLLLELSERNRDGIIKVTLLLIVVLGLLVLASRWGVSPLFALHGQLSQILSGDRQRLQPISEQELQGLVMVINDLLEQSEQRRERYQHAMNDLAHSLKTRIAAVNALLDDQQNPQQRQLLDQQLLQMDQLVQYQLRKASLGRQGLTVEQADLPDVADQLRQMLSKVYREKALHCQIVSDDNGQIPCNPSDLMELLGNTMDNAYRFARSQVRVSLFKRNHFNQIVIEDDGQGFGADDLGRLLRRGERADERSDGQGIGLAVCQEIADSYGGEVLLGRSSLGGAKVSITLANQTTLP
ncbi:sensor histidine kinase [Ferrimonas senticii]|uniref:sensor histidine kinase n=1 Tax=Ferrimonas senticii TaxID=394566 RepID=UPI00040DCE6E|nr:sensor histidine kinase [Ferrimonas senticii]